jgi:hypothetical protein
VTASEFTFLALGLLLGVAAGAALIEILRARPPAPREVKVTVAQDAIPRRASTLADDAFAVASAEPARGGPADRREGAPAGIPAGTVERRTPVLSPATMALAIGATGAGGATSGGASTAERVGVPVRGGDDPLLTALRASAAASAAAAMRPTTTAVMDRPGTEREPADADAAAAASQTAPSTSAPSAAGAGRDDAAAAVTTAPTGGASTDVAASNPCADLRHLADERCEIATRARAGAVTAEETLRAGQRAYDEHSARADRAALAADPRAVRQSKDDAQARFRSARSTAGTTEEVEAAARTWLLEINQINAEARDASATLTREREAVRVLTLDLERVAMEAEAARIAAETAEAACLAAREAVATCEEAAAGPVARMPPPVLRPPDEEARDDDEPLVAALGSGGTPRIFRLVRGDRSAMVELVAAMAGDDPGERKHWQLALSDLVDAILADSIAAASLDFPGEHPFWGPFTLEQNRDIARALSSLGYRFDGLGGWVDGRVPSQRDLSLALGYAGLDPMRIRHWPTEPEMNELYREVSVAADERLAGAAGDLTLGELVSMLGRRADGLADVWNQWGRLRPLLLEEH